jgi:YD repeat-containing protein
LENAVKVIYDQETDTLSIILTDGKVAESDEARPGMILDYDKSGRLLSIELLDASDQVKAPQSVEFALGASE